MTAHDQDLKKELDATLQTRKELGAEYEAELVESFLEKVERKLDTTADRRVRRQLAEQQMTTARGGERPRGELEFGTFGERFGFAAVSMVLAIPLSAIGGHMGGLSGLLVTWAGIVGVNAVQAFGRLPRARKYRPSDD